MIDPIDFKKRSTLLASWVRSAGEDDPEAFAQMVRLLDETMDLMPAAADELRRRGHSWTQLSSAMGRRDRSTARKRFGRSRCEPPPVVR